MRVSVGLKDLLFGERVSVTMATPRGPVTRRVTARWLAKMQAEGMFDAVPLDSEEYATVHVIDVHRGYSTVIWKIGEDIPAEVFRRFRDESGALFVVRTHDSDVKRSFALKRTAWEALRDRPWSAEPPRPALSRMAPGGTGDPQYPLPLRVGLGIAETSVRLTAHARGTTPEQLANATPRFTDDRRPFWSRIFAIGALIGVALLFRNGWPSISVSGIFYGLLTALNYAGYAALLVASIPILFRLYAGARIQGRRVFSRTLTTAALYRKSTNASDAIKLWPIGLASGSLLVVLALFVGVQNVLGLGCFVLVTAMGMALPYVSPPGVLFLGASSPRALDLLATLRERMTCRVAALLDTSATISETVGDYMSLDNFRASDHAEWRALVAALTDICVVSVLDAAAPTEHVLFEAGEAFRRGALNEVIFVADSNGRFPVLERLSSTGAATNDHQVYVAHPSELDIAVRSSLWNKVYGGRFPRLVKATTIGEVVHAVPQHASRTGYLDMETIRAHPGTIGELDYCDRDRSTAEEDTVTS